MTERKDRLGALFKKDQKKKRRRYCQGGERPYMGKESPGGGTARLEKPQTFGNRKSLASNSEKNARARTTQTRFNEKKTRRAFC